MITCFADTHTLGLYGEQLEHTSICISQNRETHTLADAGVCAAEAASLLAVTVEPHAENHEDQPAGGANASDKCRLPHHI